MINFEIFIFVSEILKDSKTFCFTDSCIRFYRNRLTESISCIHASRDKNHLKTNNEPIVFQACEFSRDIYYYFFHAGSILWYSTTVKKIRYR